MHIKFVFNQKFPSFGAFIIQPIEKYLHQFAFVCELIKMQKLNKPKNCWIHDLKQTNCLLNIAQICCYILRDVHV